MKKILIAGDSFAADWTIKYSGYGWVNKLTEDFEVKNVAEAGVSEYKIYQQIKKEKLENYDHVIISHTSAYRIPIDQHPIHKDDILHKNCDLIFSDIKEHTTDPIMKTAYDFYKDIFNQEYFIFINSLIYKEIKLLSNNIKHITFFDNFYDDDVLKFEGVFLKNKGKINHMNEKGNMIIYNKIKQLINEGNSQF
jgi:hypothetical protein